jgi:hypothetical protein
MGLDPEALAFCVTARPESIEPHLNHGREWTVPDEDTATNVGRVDSVPV